VVRRPGEARRHVALPARVRRGEEAATATARGSWRMVAVVREKLRGGRAGELQGRRIAGREKLLAWKESGGSSWQLW
jgi:hypothetical protein